jgi:hypothetical protein
MNDNLKAYLTPVRQRQKLVMATGWAVRGLLVSALIAIAIESLRRVLGWWYTPVPAAAVALSGPIIGAAAGLFYPITWRYVAAAIDRCYQLQDRTTTALAFDEDGNDHPLRALAVADALERLEQVDPRRVAPMGLPGTWQPAALAVLMAAVLTCWPGPMRQAQAIVLPPNPGFVEEAKQLKEQFEQLKQIAQEQEDPQLKELSKKLIEQADQMKQPGVELADALATLSQMQAQLMQQQAKFNIAMTDAHLKSLGEAMASSESLAQVGKALEQGEYEKAARQLESMTHITPSSSAKRRLAKVAGDMAKAGLNKLSKVAASLSEAHSSKSDKKSNDQARYSLAQGLRKQAGRKRASKWMMSQLAKLSQSKSACSSCAGGAGGRNGGNSNSLTNKPSNNWGTGTSGNPKGDPTEIDANRQLERITGIAGDGPVDTEVMHSPEARQMAGREYRKTYQQYRKMSESVLESEPIPLGHRRTIQRYFESIRPTGTPDTPDTADNK